MKKSIRFLLALLVLVSALALQSFAAEPEFRFELTVEASLTSEAAFVAYLDRRFIRLAEKLSRLIYSELGKERAEIEAEYTADAMREIIRAVSDSLGDRLEVYLLGEMLVYIGSDLGRNGSVRKSVNKRYLGGIIL